MFVTVIHLPGNEIQPNQSIRARGTVEIDFAFYNWKISVSKYIYIFLYVYQVYDIK